MLFNFFGTICRAVDHVLKKYSEFNNSDHTGCFRRYDLNEIHSRTFACKIEIPLVTMIGIFVVKNNFSLSAINNDV